MFGFLQLQAAAGAVLAISMLLAARNPASLGVGDAIGALVLAAAIVGEAVADAQLRRFRRDPTNHGKVCDVGLWRLSRHPNYFFEWLGWLAYPLFALSERAPDRLAGAVRSFAHVLAAGSRLRHPTARGGDAAQPGGCLSRLSGADSAFRAAAVGRSMMGLVSAAERLPIPDVLTRAGIALMVNRTSRSLGEADPSAEREFAAAMSAYPIAEHMAAANEQHYELPPEFFELILGPRLKYSCCLYDGPKRSARQRNGRSPKPPAMPESSTGSASWSSAAAGDRCRCGWPSAFPRPASSRCRTPTSSVGISRRRRPDAGSPRSGSSPPI